MSPRDREAGVVLLNVLVVLALAAGVVVLALDAQDRAVMRTALAADLARAEALARAGETSAIAALRRDAETAPEVDHLAEPWARVAQRPVEIEGGRFALALSDVRARFDLNRLADRRVAELEAFRRLALGLGLEETVVRSVVSALAGRGPVAGLDALPGLTDGDRGRLAPHVEILPPALSGPVNLNTAGAAVLAALAGGTDAGARLRALRATEGFVDEARLRASDLTLPPGTAFGSDLWDVSVEATVGNATARLESRLWRREDADGTVSVVVVARDPLAPVSGPPPPVGLD